MSTTPERPDSEDTDQDTTSLPAEQSRAQDHEQSSEQSHEQSAPPPPPPPVAFGAEGVTEAPAPAAPPPPTAPQSPPPQSPGPGGDYGPPPAGYGSAPAYAPAAGTVAPLSPQEEKGWSLAAHLLVLVGGFVAPLIIWLVFKGRGPFLEHHAKESLNFQITVMIAMFVAVILMFLLVGFVLVLALIPWMVVMPILAAVKSNNGEWYRYPLTLRLVK
jgi:uncharacterized protein